LLAQSSQREEFLEYVGEEYEEIRKDYFDGLKDKRYVTIGEARKNNLKINWNDFTPSRNQISLLNFNYSIIR
jgi:5-methyltetrahydrofolate--homocysteine methyltransferase